MVKDAQIVRTADKKIRPLLSSGVGSPRNVRPATVLWRVAGHRRRLIRDAMCCALNLAQQARRTEPDKQSAALQVACRFWRTAMCRVLPGSKRSYGFKFYFNWKLASKLYERTCSSGACTTRNGNGFPSRPK